MSKEGSVAPRERVNITYRSATGGEQSDVELPFKILVVGDFSGHEDARPVEERSPVSVDKDNFNQVMTEHRLEVTTAVPNLIGGASGADLNVNLRLRSLADFTPDGIASQVPELESLLALRSALVALKGPMGNAPAFRKKIQGLLENAGTRERLMNELGLAED